MTAADRIQKAIDDTNEELHWLVSREPGMRWMDQFHSAVMFRAGLSRALDLLDKTDGTPSKGHYLAKEDAIEMQGKVIDKHPGSLFTVQLDATQHTVLATIGGRLRRNHIRILTGDRVQVEISPYDLGKGRITYRFR